MDQFVLPPTEKLYFHLSLLITYFITESLNWVQCKHLNIESFIDRSDEHHLESRKLTNELFDWFQNLTEIEVDSVLGLNCSTGFVSYLDWCNSKLFCEEVPVFHPGLCASIYLSIQSIISMTINNDHRAPITCWCYSARRSAMQPFQALALFSSTIVLSCNIFLK